MLSKLEGSRNSILFIELAGLLHDIGKLSQAFLEYRQKWQDDPKGYDNDPHEHDYLEHDVKVFKPLIPSEFNKQIKEIDGHDFCQPDFSIERAIHSHVRPDPGALINQMLKAADGLDAAIDRNNPLWSAEQKGTIFKSNVFGYEGGRAVSLESQEQARKELYINMKLSEYFESFDSVHRSRVIDVINNAFEQGLADTARPANDTTLWEHSYAVASILKVLAVHNLLNDEEKIYDFKDVRFGILGIGWDGMRFLSYGQKIGDIIGRKKVIDDVKDNLKILIEFKYPIGNVIYADDDGIYFIVPVNLKYNLSAIWTEIEKGIYKKTAEISHGEIQPQIIDVPDTMTLTSLATAIKKVRAMIPYPFDSSVEGFDEFGIQTGYSSRKTICPICRLRPVKDDEEKKKLCGICRNRRIGTNTSSSETVFIDELVDKNRRAALVVARFGLDEWLNGNMVRSLFVTEAKGIEKEIENLGKVKQFEKEELDIKKFLEEKKFEYGEFNYNRIKADIDALFYDQDTDAERARHTAFIYDRRVAEGHLFRDIKKTKKRWEELLEAAKQEKQVIDIYTLLNAKTPTPSTILDVWDTTKEFIEDIPFMLKSLSPEYRRLKLNVQSNNDANKSIYDWGGGTIEGELVSLKQQIELIYVSTNVVEVVGEIYPTGNVWRESEIKITEKSSSLNGSLYKVVSTRAGSSYVPCRTITTSPNLFMAIVPADRALEISGLIYQKYIEQFGKVIGRLPFSIGNIFFGDKMPMFVVLDSGKRMVANFDNLGRKKREFTIFKYKEDIGSTVKFQLKCDLNGRGKALTWQLPHKLGNCAEDYHHPYFTIDTGNNDITADAERSTFFRRASGDIIHFSQIKSGDKLTLYPNYYDFEFLDSNARRHDLCLDIKGNRRSSVANFKSKPFLLDELAQKITYLWKDLLQGKKLKGITDTKLRNLQSLWLTKYQEWVRNEDKESFKQWGNLVCTSLKREFELSQEQQDILHETIENGLFFDTLELYLGILKERVDE